MANQVFKRYELKYLLHKKDKEKILKAMEPYMEIDRYGKTEIRNLYFDTASYRLIRHSIEKPKYKEKLRIRSYGRASAQSLVFVELKKKYKSVVYKRRISLSEREAMKWLIDRVPLTDTSQISEEIDYFLSYYKGIHPTVFLSYEREAYYQKCGGDFRVTFDSNILCREDNLSLTAESGGIPLLEEDMVLMEIKTSMGMPLWMARVLSEEYIYKTSFSKYGTAYRTIIYPKLKERITND